MHAQALLADVREIVGEGKWEELEGALQRIRGTPNNSEANLRDAAYSKHSGLPLMLTTTTTYYQKRPGLCTQVPLTDQA